MTTKRSEGAEAGDFHGGMYEAAVGQEKRDDSRSHAEPVDRGLSEDDSGSEPEEVSVAALNVRLQRICSSYIHIYSH